MKRLKRALFVVCCLLLLGCARKNDDSKLEKEMMNFAKFSQEQRKSYIARYLKEQYDITATISDVDRRPINSFTSEENYFALATCEDNTIIYCWVSNEGVVWDSKFVNDLSEDINQMFKTRLEKVLDDYKVYCECRLKSPTEKKWSANELESMLKEEDIEISIHIFMDESESDQPIGLLETELSNQMQGMSGNGYIYFVENIENINPSNCDPTKCDHYFWVKRK